MLSSLNTGPPQNHSLPGEQVSEPCATARVRAGEGTVTDCSMGTSDGKTYK